MALTGAAKPQQDQDDTENEVEEEEKDDKDDTLLADAESSETLLATPAQVFALAAPIAAFAAVETGNTWTAYVKATTTGVTTTGTAWAQDANGAWILPVGYDSVAIEGCQTNYASGEYDNTTFPAGGGAIFLCGEGTAATKFTQKAYMSIDVTGDIEFTNNWAKLSGSWGRGGAIAMNWAELTLRSGADIIFESNQGGYGGALNVRRSSVLEIVGGKSVQFTGNKTNANSGGAIYVDTSFIKISNILGGSDPYGVVFKGNSSTKYGGVIYANAKMGDKDCTVEICKNAGVAFQENTASGSGGAGGAIYVTTDASINIHHNTGVGDNAAVLFSGNESAYNQGGAIYTYSSGSVTIDNNGAVVFSGNAAKSSGGAIMADSGSTLNLTNNASVSFAGNTASTGGGIYATGATVSIAGNTGDVSFTGGGTKTISGGGAIYAESNSSVTIGGNGAVTFSGNTVSSYGGAIYARTDSTVQISDSGNILFQNNTSGALGGAILLAYYDSNAEDCDSTGATLKILGNQDVTFSGNDSVRGGAIFGYRSSVDIGGNTGCVTFSDNGLASATFGGAIQVRQNSTLTLDGNAAAVFRNNAASSGGGALFVTASDFSILNHQGDGVLFSGNSAGNYGGAVDVTNGGAFTLSGNSAVRFVNNGANNCGGIYLDASTLTINNNTAVLFEGNLSTNSAGAIYSKTGANIDICGNGSVVFRGNAIVSGSTRQLRALDFAFTNSGYKTINLSAAEDGTIEFYDSIRVEGGSSVVKLNATAGSAGAAGKIIFDGSQAQAYLEAALQTAVAKGWTSSAQATSQEIQASRTSVLNGQNTLYGGSLVVKDGAILTGSGLTVKSGAGVELVNSGNGLSGQMSWSGAATLESGSSLTMTGASNSFSASSIGFGATTTLNITGDSNSLSATSGTLSFGNNATLDLTGAYNTFSASSIVFNNNTLNFHIDDPAATAAARSYLLNLDAAVTLQGTLTVNLTIDDTFDGVLNLFTLGENYSGSWVNNVVVNIAAPGQINSYWDDDDHTYKVTYTVETPTVSQFPTMETNLTLESDQNLTVKNSGGDYVIDCNVLAVDGGTEQYSLVIDGNGKAKGAIRSGSGGMTISNLSELAIKNFGDFNKNQTSIPVITTFQEGEGETLTFSKIGKVNLCDNHIQNRDVEGSGFFRSLSKISFIECGELTIEGNSTVDTATGRTTFGTLSVKSGWSVESTRQVSICDNTVQAYDNHTAHGGAIYSCAKVSFCGNGKLDICNNTLTTSGTRAYLFGGAIRIELPAPKYGIGFDVLGIQAWESQDDISLTTSASFSSAYDVRSSTVTEALVISGQTDTVNISHNGIDAGTGEAQGGAIYVYGGESGVSYISDNKDVIFEGNYSKGGYLVSGGAIAMEISADGQFSITNNGNVIFCKNYCEGNATFGGAIYMDCGGSELVIADNESVTFRGNYVKNSSGAKLNAIYAGGVDAYISAKDDQGRAVNFYDPVYLDSDEVIFNGDATAGADSVVRFSAKYAKEDLRTIKGGEDATDAEYDASRTSTIYSGKVGLEKGILSVEEGAKLMLNSADVSVAGDATLALEMGEVVIGTASAALTLADGATLLLKRGTENVTANSSNSLAVTKGTVQAGDTLNIAIYGLSYATSGTSFLELTAASLELASTTINYTLTSLDDIREEVYYHLITVSGDITDAQRATLKDGAASMLSLNGTSYSSAKYLVWQENTLCLYFIPEPATATLSLLALAALAARRRRD